MLLERRVADEHPVQLKHRHAVAYGFGGLFWHHRPNHRTNVLQSAARRFRSVRQILVHGSRSFAFHEFVILSELEIPRSGSLAQSKDPYSRGNDESTSGNSYCKSARFTSPVSVSAPLPNPARPSSPALPKRPPRIPPSAIPSPDSPRSMPSSLPSRRRHLRSSRNSPARPR